MLFTSALSASAITYSVDRTIGNGFVFGTITTDGTIGPIFAPNIVGFQLTISSPNLFGGSPQSFDQTNGQFATSTPNLTATSTALLYDFTGISGTTFFRNNFTADGWCLTGPGGCGAAGAQGAGERLFFSTAQGGAAEFRAESSPGVVIATVAPIPLPAGLPLLAGSLGALALVRRFRPKMRKRPTSPALRIGSEADTECSR